MLNCNDCLWYDKLWGPSQRVVTLLQYYKGEGGVSRDPKFVLRNLWTAPNQNFETKIRNEMFMTINAGYADKMQEVRKS